MRHPVTIILVILTCFKSYSQTFEEVIVSKFGRNSYYINVNIDYKGAIHHAIIENTNLFFYLFPEDNVTEEQYKTRILDILKNHKTIEVNDSGINDFIIIKKDKEVAKLAEKGADALIQRYFNDSCMKNTLSDRKRATIIFHLFKLGFGCSVDCESGCILYTKIEDWNGD